LGERKNKDRKKLTKEIKKQETQERSESEERASPAFYAAHW
jgi:hypothetical protein